MRRGSVANLMQQPGMSGRALQDAWTQRVEVIVDEAKRRCISGFRVERSRSGEIAEEDRAMAHPERRARLEEVLREEPAELAHRRDDVAARRRVTP